MSTRPEGFSLHISAPAIADLRERLSRTRFPDQAPGESWAYGTDLGYMRSLVEYWRDNFDWRAEEARLKRVLGLHRWPIILTDADCQGGWSWGYGASAAEAKSTSRTG